ncbi:MAG TPA: helix-turn-helix domain-containing protein [Limnochordia bacterium]
MLTTEEVAERLSVRPNTVRVWLRRGELRGVQIHGRWRIPETALRSFLGGDDEPLSPEDWAAIREGLEDIKAGRVVEWEEYKRRRP